MITQEIIKAYEHSAEECLISANTTLSKGLSEKTALEFLEKYGPNALPPPKEVSLWILLVRQVNSPVVYLLGIAALISAYFGDFSEAIAIGFVLLINTCIGFFMEAQTRASVRALRSFDENESKVLREGIWKTIPSSKLTYSDIISIEEGDLIPADARIVENYGLEVDESSLTGESLVIEKHTRKLPSETLLADRKNMLYKGTFVRKGSAIALITGVGLQTEIGKVATMVQSVEEEASPLQRQLEGLGHKLIYITLVLAGAYILAGLLRGEAWFILLETSLALSVAAVPEGLPVVSTMALAYGMLKLAQHQVLIKKLTSVETLGSTHVIFTDKTGTLTENRMKLKEIFTFESGISTLQEPSESTLSVLKIGALCNNAKKSEENSFIGDPLEIAFLEAIEDPSIDLSTYRKIAEVPFSSETKRMITQYSSKNVYHLFMKGALEAVLELCTHYQFKEQKIVLSEESRSEILKNLEAMASRGQKVLGLAAAIFDESQVEMAAPKFTFYGLAGFMDPPRMEVPLSIQQCYQAGVRVVMMTGDHPKTAASIGKQIGMKFSDSEVVHGSILPLKEEEFEDLPPAVIYSRLSPAQKLYILKSFQKKGFICAMTGDGVNDAPALRQAHLGIAMGKRGTQVAREAADMILLDDAFSSIVRAIKRGRQLFDNLRTFVKYLISCNLSELFIIGFCGITGILPTLTPLQILFVNVISDIFPALSIGLQPTRVGSMSHPPRDAAEEILRKKDWKEILWQALIFSTTLPLGVFILHRNGVIDDESIQESLFLSIALTQVWQPFFLRSEGEGFFKASVWKNKYQYLATLVCIVIVILMYSFDFSRSILDLRHLHTLELWAVVGLSMVPQLFMAAYYFIRGIEKE